MLDYEIFFRFFNRFKAGHFQDIDPRDPLVLQTEEKLAETGQFFHIADLIELKILYLCGKCHSYFGVQCEQMNPAVYFENTHPDDIKRHALGRSMLFKIGSEMYHDKSKNWYISSHFNTRTNSGKYQDLLYQLCLIYTDTPYPRVYSIQVNTNVTELIKNYHGFHYYIGREKSYFRYPDSELLSIGYTFTKREFEVIKCIARGMDSHEIATELFVSVHTVNTHRRNILLKTNKRNTHELVHELKENGVI